MARKLAENKLFPQRLHQLDLMMTQALHNPRDQLAASSPYVKAAGGTHLPQIWRLEEEEEENVC